VIPIVYSNPGAVKEPGEPHLGHQHLWQIIHDKNMQRAPCEPHRFSISRLSTDQWHQLRMVGRETILHF
jgi:hypothetical protein